MKEKIEDIYADIANQYGGSQFWRNVRYILSLIKERQKEDGTIDDNIPVPSVEEKLIFSANMLFYSQLLYYCPKIYIRHMVLLVTRFILL